MFTPFPPNILRLLSMPAILLWFKFNTFHIYRVRIVLIRNKSYLIPRV